MNQDDEKLLNKNGWTVECYSPFEIRHKESENFATNLAAEQILWSLKKLDELLRRLDE